MARTAISIPVEAIFFFAEGFGFEESELLSISCFTETVWWGDFDLTLLDFDSKNFLKVDIFALEGAFSPSFAINHTDSSSLDEESNFLLIAFSKIFHFNFYFFVPVLESTLD